MTVLNGALSENGSEKFFQRLNWWPWGCFFLLLIISIGPLWFDVLPQRDVAFRYAPMAEAFRDGHYLYAFHPRTGFLHTFCAGIIAWLFQCDGFLACKLSSLLFMALSVFPLYALLRKIYDRNLAEFSTLLFVFASQLQRLGGSGLRDAHKVFLILLAAYALITIYQERERWAGYLWLGAAAGAGMVTRGDLVLFMSLVYFWGMILEWKNKRFPWKSLLGAVILLILAAPAILLNGMLFGAAVPEIRFAMLFEKLLHRMPLLKDLPLIVSAGLAAVLAGSFVTRKIWDWKRGIKVLLSGGILVLILALCWKIRTPGFGFTEKGIPWDYFLSVGKGFFPLVAFFAIIGMGIRIFRKEWTKEETFLAVLLFGHALLVTLQIIFFENYLYVSPRYLLPAVPLELGWAVIGVRAVWNGMTGGLQNKNSRTVQWLGTVLLLGTLLLLIYDTFRPVWLDYTRKKDIRYRKEIFRLAETIREDYHGPKYFCPPLHPVRYIPNRNPGVTFIKYDEEQHKTVTDYGRVTLLARLTGGRFVDNAREADYIVEQISEKTVMPVAATVLMETDLGKGKYRVWRIKH